MGHIASYCSIRLHAPNELCVSVMPFHQEIEREKESAWATITAIRTTATAKKNYWGNILEQAIRKQKYAKGLNTLWHCGKGSLYTSNCSLVLYLKHVYMHICTALWTQYLTRKKSAHKKLSKRKSERAIVQKWQRKRNSTNDIVNVEECNGRHNSFFEWA